MNVPLRVLLLEDSEDDALLMLRELRRSGYDPSWERHETAAGMTEALQRQSWDIILCDYHMPSFSAPVALQLLDTYGSDIPVIVVSGEPFEEIGPRVLSAGARDYVFKGHLETLGAAVVRELAINAARQARCRQLA